VLDVAAVVDLVHAASPGLYAIYPAVSRPTQTSCHINSRDVKYFQTDGPLCEPLISGIIFSNTYAPSFFTTNVFFTILTHYLWTTGSLCEPYFDDRSAAHIRNPVADPSFAAANGENLSLAAPRRTALPQASGVPTHPQGETAWLEHCHTSAFST
jgi:hypothetical protein